jgi:hypothetical protein
MSDSGVVNTKSPRVSDSDLSEVGPSTNEVTTTNVLVRKRLATGDKLSYSLILSEPQKIYQQISHHSRTWKRIFWRCIFSP